MASRVKKALNLRFVRLETKFSNKSVLPSSNSFFICSRSISCCNMTLLLRKSQLFSGPTAFSHTYFMPCSNTLAWHLGQGPTGSLAEKSTGSLSSSSFWPKSNSSLFSALMRKIAAKGRPILLIKPVSGPMVLFCNSSSTSGISKVLPPGCLPMENSQLVQA